MGGAPVGAGAARSAGPAGKKLMIVVIDALRPDVLRAAIEAGVAPNLGALVARGQRTDRLISSFPSVTPVASAEIATGHGSQAHRIAGMNWYDRAEGRYVEYGTSFEATRALGLVTVVRDVVYNMNLAHLSPRIPTIFERIADAGLRSACTPFLVFRGRRRHEVSLEGALGRVARAARLSHPVWGPEELFYGELYASMDVPCKPTLARPGTRDAYSACAARELIRQERYEAMLLSLPDNDHHCHRQGPTAGLDPVAGADARLGEVIEAAGGVDALLETHAVAVIADHGQSDVSRPLDLGRALGDRWRVLGPRSPDPERAELAVSPTSRAAGLYVLAGGRAAHRRHRAVREALGELDGVELVAWLEGEDGRPLVRPGPGAPAAGSVEAVVRGFGGTLRFRPGSEVRGERGDGWDVEGEMGAIAAERSGSELVTLAYPDAPARLWSALTAPDSGDIVVSLAPGYECVDWGGAWHPGGGSHGSLGATDSLAPMVLAGTERADLSARPAWRLTDVAELALGELGDLPLEAAGPPPEDERPDA